MFFSGIFFLLFPSHLLPYIAEYIFDRKIAAFLQNFCMVYMIISLVSFCIRNALAALVMKYGIMPFCDLRASSYAYKMRI